MRSLADVSHATAAIKTAQGRVRRASEGSLSWQKETEGADWKKTREGLVGGRRKRRTRHQSLPKFRSTSATAQFFLSLVAVVGRAEATHTHTRFSLNGQHALPRRRVGRPGTDGRTDGQFICISRRAMICGWVPSPYTECCKRVQPSDSRPSLIPLFFGRSSLLGLGPNPNLSTSQGLPRLKPHWLARGLPPALAAAAAALRKCNSTQRECTYRRLPLPSPFHAFVSLGMVRWRISNEDVSFASNICG